MAHLVANLGWVDLNFDYSTVCLILLGLMGVWQKRMGSWARWWNSQIKSIEARFATRWAILYMEKASPRSANFSRIIISLIMSVIHTTPNPHTNLKPLPVYRLQQGPRGQACVTTCLALWALCLALWASKKHILP